MLTHVRLPFPISPLFFDLLTLLPPPFPPHQSVLDTLIAWVATHCPNLLQDGQPMQGCVFVCCCCALCFPKCQFFMPKRVLSVFFSPHCLSHTAISPTIHIPFLQTVVEFRVVESPCGQHDPLMLALRAAATTIGKGARAISFCVSPLSLSLSLSLFVSCSLAFSFFLSLFLSLSISFSFSLSLSSLFFLSLSFVAPSFFLYLPLSLQASLLLRL